MTGKPLVGGRRQAFGPRQRDPRAETVWLFGRHAVREALVNPRRKRLRLIVTKNSADKLSEAIAVSGMKPELVDARAFPAPLDPSSVHQGAALEVRPLEWGSLIDVCGICRDLPMVALLDRVTDPQNVGAVIRSAEAFGANAVVAPARHSPPETGALGKAASGALERVPYLRVRNLAQAIETLKNLDYAIIGLASDAERDLQSAMRDCSQRAVAVVIGAEGRGLRQLTRSSCDTIARIPSAGVFDSLNASNAAAISMYAALTARQER